MDITLTPELEKFVAESVASGRYSSPSDLIDAGIRRLEEEQLWLENAKAKIAAGLDDLANGRFYTREQLIARIEERRRKAA